MRSTSPVMEALPRLSQISKTDIPVPPQGKAYCCFGPLMQSTICLVSLTVLHTSEHVNRRPFWDCRLTDSISQTLANFTKSHSIWIYYVQEPFFNPAGNPPPLKKKKNVNIVRLIKPGMGLWIHLYISYVSYKHFNNMWHTTLILLLYELTVMSGTSDGGVMNARCDGCQAKDHFSSSRNNKTLSFYLMQGPFPC